MATRLRQELGAAVGRDFEKAALPYFELVFPTITRPPDLGYWDRRGIDLMTPPDERPIEACVQCKSTGEPAFDGKAIANILADIDKFLGYDVPAKLYIVGLNRGDVGGAVRAAVDGHLLSYTGDTRFEVWDVTRIKREATEHVVLLIRARIDAFNAIWRDQLTGRFSPSGKWVREVPVRTFRLVLRFDAEPELREREDLASADVAQLLLNDEGPRMALLTGHFGSGKTAATLITSQQVDRTVLYVPAAALTSGNVASSTGALAKEIGRVLGVTPIGVEPSRVFYYLLGKAFTRILRNEERMVLIIDGLDENRVMRGVDGLHRLRLQLNDSVCRIILSTRTTHLALQGEDLAATFVDLGRVGRRNRGVRVVELKPWTQQTIEDHIRSAANQVAAGSARRLKDLIALIQQGRAEAFYGTLLSHPIFLDLIVDDVAADRIRLVSRTVLVRSWIRRKIARDQAKYTGNILREGRAEEARLIFDVLERLALEMSDPETRTPRERIDFRRLGELLADEGLPRAEIVELLLKSVLVTVGLKTAQRDAQLMFAHRIFHEFLIAAALAGRREALPQKAPAEVRDFLAEIYTEAVLSAPSGLGEL